MTSTEAGKYTFAARGKEVSPETIPRDILAAMEKRHPLEATLAKILIAEGAWALAE